MQQLSHRLGDLLYVDIPQLVESVKYYEGLLDTEGAMNLHAVLGNKDTLEERIKDNMSMYLALGEHVSLFAHSFFLDYL